MVLSTDFVLCGSLKTLRIFTVYLLLWSMLLSTLAFVYIFSVLLHISPDMKLNTSTSFYEKSTHMEHFVKLVDFLKTIKARGGRVTSQNFLLSLPLSSSAQFNTPPQIFILVKHSTSGLFSTDLRLTQTLVAQ